MRMRLFGLALAIGVIAANGVATVPAAARGGGFPSQIGPSYPYPTYCAVCWPPQYQPFVTVRHPKAYHRVHSSK